LILAAFFTGPKFKEIQGIHHSDKDENELEEFEKGRVKERWGNGISRRREFDGYLEGSERTEGRRREIWWKEGGGKGCESLKREVRCKEDRRWTMREGRNLGEHYTVNGYKVRYD